MTAPAHGFCGMPAKDVYLHAGRWAHPVLRQQLQAIPPGFRYVHTHPALSDPTAGTPRMAATNSTRAALVHRGRPAGLRIAGAAGFVRRSRAEPPPRAALIHSSQYLLKDPALPYVLDFEHVQAFTLFQRPALSLPWSRKILTAAVRDESLRCLMPWSDAAGESLLNALSPDDGRAVAAKLRTVYQCATPAVGRPSEFSGGQLRVLFIGTHFYEKGAVETISAIRELRATHDVRLDLVSYVPDDWQRLLADDAAITVHAPGPFSLLDQLYRRSHVLVFPSHMDTYGVVVGEAMSYGLPVVASDQFAIPELVEDDVSGLLFPYENSLWRADRLSEFRFLLPPPRRLRQALRHPTGAYVSALTQILARLIDEPGLQGRLAAGALQQVTQGRFSIARRRDRLQEIYTLALA